MLITVPPTPSLFDDGSSTGKSAVDIWVVMPKQSMTNSSEIADAIAKGDEVWSYNTLVQDSYSPKWELDFASINYRIQPGFLNQIYGFTGLLYWGVDQWSSDPWNDPSSLVAGKFEYPGEGLLVYPGAQVGLSSVVPSMRLKWLRDGVDDYDYIQLLKNAGQSSWVSEMISEVATDWANWTKSPNVLEEVRKQMGDKLDQLETSKGASAPTEPTNTALPSGIYTIRNAFSGWVLDDPNWSTQSGTQVIQWAPNGGNNQKWVITASGDGFYTIMNYFNGLYLCAQDRQDDTSYRNGSNSELWSIKRSDSTYVLINNYTGDAVDDPAFSLIQGVGMLAWQPNSGRNQAWIIQ
jgi:hypothetical protein